MSEFHQHWHGEERKCKNYEEKFLNWKRKNQSVQKSKDVQKETTLRRVEIIRRQIWSRKTDHDQQTYSIFFRKFRVSKILPPKLSSVFYLPSFINQKQQKKSKTQPSHQKTYIYFYACSIRGYLFNTLSPSKTSESIIRYQLKSEYQKVSISSKKLKFN